MNRTGRPDPIVVVRARSDDDLKAMSARRLKEEEGKTAVAGDETEFVHSQ